MPSATRDREIVLRNYCVDSDTFLADILESLSRPQKSIPSKYFYDERGSQLFDRITELEEYYPTQTELSIMRDYMPEIAARLGRHVLLVEYGSGNSQKTRIVLDHLVEPAGYVPIDISREHLMDAAKRLAQEYESLDIMPVCADYTQTFPMPEPGVPQERTVVFFPGSTIGNLTPDQATGFLKHVRSVGDQLLLGVDLVKDRSVLEAAYNDREGVTAAFNLNILDHANRQVGSDFDTAAYRHRAYFNESESRIEMHLVPVRDQVVRIGDEQIRISTDETILTEYSYKYTLDRLADLASRAGLVVEEACTDARQYFAICLLSSA